MTRALIAGEAPPEPATANTSLTVQAEALRFDLDSTTKASIDAAQREYDGHVANYDLRFLLYTRYGKDAIKAAKTSPDGWVQMVMQLAYALTHAGAAAATYESAQVRRFHLGRTEVVRVCTEASRAWTKAMLDGSTSVEDKRRLFKEAVAQQGKDMKESSNGLGVDRHLLGA
jgi:carnitine O-acetyltransferase